MHLKGLNAYSKIYRKKNNLLWHRAECSNSAWRILDGSSAAAAAAIPARNKQRAGEEDQQEGRISFWFGVLPPPQFQTLLGISKDSKAAWPNRSILSVSAESVLGIMLSLPVIMSVCADLAHAQGKAADKVRE